MADLTAGQERVVAHVASGLTVLQVAKRLHIAPSTARAHVKNAQATLDLHTLQALTAWWWRRQNTAVTLAARAVVDMPHDQGLAELARRVRALAEALREEPHG